MNEYLLEIRYLVDDLGDIDVNNDLLRPEQMQGFVYVLMIYLNNQFYKTDELSTVSIMRGNEEFLSRTISTTEIRLLLEAVSNIKFSFSSSEVIAGKIPRRNYSITIRRGTALMSFAWADGQYITNDAELLSSLLKLVNLIALLEPIYCNGFVLQPPTEK
jgi:hypothetical protein